MNKFNVEHFRSQFPLLAIRSHGLPLVYVDNGATTQKPHCVIDAQTEFYQQSNANVHRASYTLSSQSTAAFEQARDKVKQLINAKNREEIIWTKGCTESINLVAQTWGIANLQAGDEIVLSYAEHHANIVPWQLLAQRTGAKINVLPLTPSGIIDEEKVKEVISRRTRIVAVCHISNVIGKINPIKSVVAHAKSVGAITLIDGAQAIAHLNVDVQQLDCDFYAFSAHKMYGPTGVGVLYGKLELLNNMPPYQSGGEMISTVTFEKTSFQKPPFKFEAGTPNIAGVVGFNQAINFIHTNRLNKSLEYENQLIDYAYKKFGDIPGLKMLVEGKPDIPLFSFTLEDNVQDVASLLDSKGIAARVGRHCAMPLYQYLNVDGAIRISLAPYNTKQEVDYIVDVLASNVKVDNVRHQQGVDMLSNDNSVAADDLIARFSKLKGWDSRHRELMLLGKSLQRMDKAKRSEETLIKGCESAAWLSYSIDNKGKYHFSCDSDAKIIRGLLAVVLSPYQGKTAQEIQTFEIDQFFEKLGLLQHLSPSRGNGLLAIKDKIIEVAQ
ncbi:SufS family cysteine desulfurase [Thalassotalea ganghwensis]